MIKYWDDVRQLYEISKIHTDNRRRTYRGILDEKYLELINYEYTYEKWKKYVEKGDRDVILYEIDGEIAGFASMKFYRRPNCGYLNNLHVREDMQHKGIGRALISAVASILKDMGIKSMEVCVVDGNSRAEELYCSLGAVLKKSFMTAWSGYPVHIKCLVWDDIDSISVYALPPRGDYQYDDIKKVLGKPFYLFGDGKFCDRFLQQFPQYVPEAIFDNNESKWGSYRNEILIDKPHRCDNVIITSCAYAEIEKQLMGIGCSNIVKFYPWHIYGGESEKI